MTDFFFQFTIFTQIELENQTDAFKVEIYTQLTNEQLPETNKT